MTQAAPTVIAVFLIGVSAALVWSHLSARRRATAAEHDKTENRFRARQHRRRMLTSVTVGLLGAAILAGQFVQAERQPLAFVAFWSAVVLATCWICLSAVVDMLATSQYAGARRRQRQTELRRLEDELRQYDRRQRNGNGTDTA